MAERDTQAESNGTEWKTLSESSGTEWKTLSESSGTEWKTLSESNGTEWNILSESNRTEWNRLAESEIQAERNQANGSMDSGFMDMENRKAVEIAKRPVRTAVYVGDPNADDEREMLLQYVEKNPSLELIGCYMNGYGSHAGSGSQTHRGKDADREAYDSTADAFSAFPRLMEDVRNGKIQCIVVADFAGFARGYLETVYYIQNYFQYMNIRFISVNDDFDSAKKEDMARIAKKADRKVTDLRSRQNSKIRCENAKKRTSEPDAMPTGTAPFGYLVAPDPERKYYIPDPDTAPYVRMIFKWALLGLSSRQIADRLILLGVPTPGQLRNGEPVDPSKWEAHCVLKILQNPNYTGSIYMGRMHQALYKAQPRQKISAEEWTVRENTHEPLVTKEDFEEVQKRILQNRRRPDRYEQVAR